MKVKEYPVSIFHTLRLLLTPRRMLGRRARPAGFPLVVSLTSIPSRLAILHITIRSLLSQSVRPDRIVLWLHHDLKGTLPARLVALQDERFQIRFADQTGPHRKLVHSLTVFPQAAIVTCDDDQIYRYRWLEHLVAEHLRHPHDIVAHECRRIRFAADGSVAPYKQWDGELPGESHRYTLAIGYGGTLYPAGCLHADVTHADLYDRLAPRADDLWFKAMSLRIGTATRRSLQPPAKPIPIIASQQERLGSTNIKQDGNRLQWQALVDHYGLGPDAAMAQEAAGAASA